MKKLLMILHDIMVAIIIAIVFGFASYIALGVLARLCHIDPFNFIISIE